MADNDHELEEHHEEHHEDDGDHHLTSSNSTNNNNSIRNSNRKLRSGFTLAKLKSLMIALLVGSSLCICIGLALVLIYITNVPFKKQVTVPLVLSNYFDFQIAEFPEQASIILGKGYHDAHMSNVSIAAYAHRRAKYADLLKDLEFALPVSVSTLASSIASSSSASTIATQRLEVLNGRILQGMLKTAIDSIDVNNHLLPMTHMFGPQLSVPQMAKSTVLYSEAEAMRYIARIGEVPAHMQQNVELMKKGMELKVVLAERTASMFYSLYIHVYHNPTNKKQKNNSY